MWLGSTIAGFAASSSCQRRASPRFCCASFQRESPGCTVITFNFAGPTGAVRAGAGGCEGATRTTGAAGWEGATPRTDGFAGVGRTTGATGSAGATRTTGAGEGDTLKSGFGAAGLGGATEIAACAVGTTGAAGCTEAT